MSLDLRDLVTKMGSNKVKSRWFYFVFLLSRLPYEVPDGCASAPPHPKNISSTPEASSSSSRPITIDDLRVLISPAEASHYITQIQPSPSPVVSGPMDESLSSPERHRLSETMGKLVSTFDSGGSSRTSWDSPSLLPSRGPPSVTVRL